MFFSKDYRKRNYHGDILPYDGSYGSAGHFHSGHAEKSEDKYWVKYNICYGPYHLKNHRIHHIACCLQYFFYVYFHKNTQRKNAVYAHILYRHILDFPGGIE